MKESIKKPETTVNVRSIAEIIKHDCLQRRYNEINLDIFNKGIPYNINKLFMYYREFTGDYFIVLHTNRGYLVSMEFNSSRAQNEYSFLWEENNGTKEGTSKSINFFNYTLYDNNMEERIYISINLPDYFTSTVNENPEIRSNSFA
jgi:hypothetical protein